VRIAIDAVALWRARLTAWVMVCLWAVALAAPTLAAKPNYSADWQNWSNAIHRQCPSHHVDWIGDGGWDDLLGNFHRTLSTRLQRQVRARERAIQTRCAQTNGFSCEMAADLEIYAQLGLANRFVEFGCRHFRCTDIAVCARTGLPKE